MPNQHKVKPTSVRLSPSTKHELNELAERTGLPVHWHIVNAVNQYLRRTYKPREQ